MQTLIENGIGPFYHLIKQRIYWCTIAQTQLAIHNDFTINSFVVL